MSQSKHPNQQTSVEEKNKPSISRREFGKIAAGLGLATVSGLGSVLKAEEQAQNIRENMQIKYIDGTMQWKIDYSKFKRFDHMNTAFNVVPRRKKIAWFKVETKNAVKNMKAAKHHPEIPAESVADARAVRSLQNAARHFKSVGGRGEGNGYYNDKPKKVPPFLLGKPNEKDPKKLTVQTKLASRFFWCRYRRYGSIKS